MYGRWEVCVPSRATDRRYGTHDGDVLSSGQPLAVLVLLRHLVAGAHFAQGLKQAGATVQQSPIAGATARASKLMVRDRWCDAGVGK